MKNLSPTLAIALLALMLAGCSNAPAGVMVEQGEVARWDQRLRRELREGRNDVSARLVAGGAESIPLLVALGSQPENIMRGKSLELLYEIGPETCVEPLTEWVAKGNVPEAGFAARGLSLFGSKAAESAPALVRRMVRMHQRGERLETDSFREALIQIGPDAIPHVAPLAHNEHLRDEAFKILMSYGILSVPALEELQRSSETPVREKAYRAIMEIRAEERALTEYYLKYPEYIRVLEQSMNDPADTRLKFPEEAVQDLEIDGLTLGQVLVKLKEHLNGPDATKRRVAVRYLGYYGPIAKDCLPQLINELRIDDAHYRWWTANTLGAMGSEASEAVPALLEMLRDDDMMTRTHAAAALARIGEPAPSATPWLREMLEPDDVIQWPVENTDFRRSCAAMAMARLDPEENIPVLIDYLEEPRWVVRRSIIEALAAAGPDAVPELRRALQDDSPRVRHGASVALLKISMRSRLGAIALDSSADSNDRVIAWASQEALRQFRLASFE